MAPDALRALLKRPEDNFIERKPAGVNRAEIRKTLGAFANSVPEGQTAVLFIGIRDNGSLDPVAAPDTVQKTIADICSRDCYPAIVFRSTTLTEQEGPILAVEIDHSRAKPHFSGPAYVRRGSQSEIASEQLFQGMVEDRTSKVAALRRMQNQIISIVSLQRKLGEDRPIVSAGYQQLAEGRILELDAHNIRLEFTSGLHVTEAISRTEPSYDEARHRPKIIIRGN
jgi:hypothetical protein